MDSLHNWKEWFQRAGVHADSVVYLSDAPGPRHVRYLDLIRGDDVNEPLPDAVVESAGVPLLYVVRQDTLGSTPSDSYTLLRLLRVLACRADARYLAVLLPGQVVVHPILMTDALRPPVLHDTEAASYATFRGLLSGAVAQLTPRDGTRRSRKATAQWLDELLFRLLSDAAKEVMCSRSPTASLTRRCQSTSSSSAGHRHEPTVSVWGCTGGQIRSHQRLARTPEKSWKPSICVRHQSCKDAPIPSCSGTCGYALDPLCGKSNLQRTLAQQNESLASFKTKKLTPAEHSRTCLTGGSILVTCACFLEASGRS